MAIRTCETCGRTDIDTWGFCVGCGTPFGEDVMSPAPSKMKVLIVGRHTPDLGNDAEKFEIVGNEAVTFSLKSGEVEDQVRGLEAKAKELGAQVILLQNVPGILAAVLIRFATLEEDFYRFAPVRWGIVISVPGERPAGVMKTFAFDLAGVSVDNASLAADAVKFANGRAVTSIESQVLTVTVDPVAPFVFDHIEWLG